MSAIFARLGQTVPPPDPVRFKTEQDYVWRFIATFATLGVYGYWWLYNAMDDANTHFMFNWAWEDTLVDAVQALARADVTE